MPANKPKPEPPPRDPRATRARTKPHPHIDDRVGIAPPRTNVDDRIIPKPSAAERRRWLTPLAPD